MVPGARYPAGQGGPAIGGPVSGGGGPGRGLPPAYPPACKGLSMYSLMLAAMVAFGQPGTGTGSGAGASDRAGSGGRDAHAGSLDGTWTVVVLEHRGLPTTSVRTVTIRNNVLTFDGAGTGSS